MEVKESFRSVKEVQNYHKHRDDNLKFVNLKNCDQQFLKPDFIMENVNENTFVEIVLQSFKDLEIEQKYLRVDLVWLNNK